jgi:hypothetical protein
MDRCGRQTREFQQKLSTTALRHASWTPPSPIVVLADTGATTASSERPHEARRARGAPNITEASAAAGRGRGGCCGEYGGCERTIGLCLPHQRLHGGTSSFHGTIDTSSLSVGPSCRRHRTNKAKHCCECDESWIQQGFLSEQAAVDCKEQYVSMSASSTHSLRHAISSRSGGPLARSRHESRGRSANHPLNAGPPGLTVRSVPLLLASFARAGPRRHVWSTAPRTVTMLAHLAPPMAAQFARRTSSPTASSGIG